MVYRTGLENRSPCKRTVGSNPTPSAPVVRPRDGSLGGVFDHVSIAVADLAASERFYRTVLSALGAEPKHADAEIVLDPDGHNVEVVNHNR